MQKKCQVISRAVMKNIWTIFAGARIFRWVMARLSIFLCGYNYLLSTIKIGRVSQPVDHIQTNITASIYDILSYLITTPVQPKHIRQISIKTAKSISIPVFCQLTKSEKQANITQKNWLNLQCMKLISLKIKLTLFNFILLVPQNAPYNWRVPQEKHASDWKRLFPEYYNKICPESKIAQAGTEKVGFGFFKFKVA